MTRLPRSAAILHQGGGKLATVTSRARYERRADLASQLIYRVGREASGAVQTLCVPPKQWAVARPGDAKKGARATSGKSLGE